MIGEGIEGYDCVAENVVELSLESSSVHHHGLLFIRATLFTTLIPDYLNPSNKELIPPLIHGFHTLSSFGDVCKHTRQHNVMHYFLGVI